LKRDLLRAGRGFAGQLVQRGGEIVAGEIEERRKRQRQRAAIVEEVVDRVADVNWLMVKLGSGAAAGASAG
jgi:hypothetical protein